jgi:hypothetical protein
MDINKDKTKILIKKCQLYLTIMLKNKNKDKIEF